MATEKNEKLPGYEELHRQVQSGSVGNVYIFQGEETYLMQQAVAELQALLVPPGFEEFNYHRLSGKGLTVQEVTEAVEAMPMMAEHTFVTVTDMDIFKLDEPQRTALTALLGDFPEYCTLVFLYRQIPYKKDARLKKLASALAEHAQEIEFAQQGQQKLFRWVRRRFAAMDWKDLDGTVWEQERELARSKEFNGSYSIVGSDIDPKALELAKENARRAGVLDVVRFEQADATMFHRQTERGILVTNPPYGERIMEKQEAEALYRNFGLAYAQSRNWQLYLLSSHTEFERTFGRTADKKRKLYNGMIKCDLFMYIK